MKKTIQKLCALLLALCLMLPLAACGEEDGVNEFNGDLAGSGGAAQVTADPYFSNNDAAAAGFGLGLDTLQDIIGRYGEPLSQSTNEYTSVTVSSAEYDFGLFEFEGAPGTTPVLSYVQINSQYTGPRGVDFGMDIETAANLIYPGSGEGLKTAPEQQKYLYGSDAPGEAYGCYTMLTIEFISSTTNDTYSLEYRADSYDEGHTVTYTLYFNAEHNMTWYTLRYI